MQVFHFLFSFTFFFFLWQQTPKSKLVTVVRSGHAWGASFDLKLYPARHRHLTGSRGSHLGPVGTFICASPQGSNSTKKSQEATFLVLGLGVKKRWVGPGAAMSFWVDYPFYCLLMYLLFKKTKPPWKLVSPDSAKLSLIWVEVVKIGWWVVIQIVKVPGNHSVDWKGALNLTSEALIPKKLLWSCAMGISGDRLAYLFKLRSDPLIWGPDSSPDKCSRVHKQVWEDSGLKSQR